MLTIRTFQYPLITYSYAYKNSKIECVVRENGIPVSDYKVEETSMTNIRNEVDLSLEEITHDDGEH